VSGALKVKLPPYETPRNAWRKKIHSAVARSMETANVKYSKDDRLVLEIELYMTERMLGFHDVDNRLKDVLDALQGRMGGPKNIHEHAKLIPNDRQIFQVVIQKVVVPNGSTEGGRLTIRRMR